MNMWYVMQVSTGQENRTAYLVEKMVSEGVIESCFVPVRRIRKKFHGRWHEVREKLFPGYVFIITEQTQLLYEELRKIPALTKLLGKCEEYFTPLSETDVNMMEKFQNGIDNNGKLEVEISKIMIEERNQIRILSGPLKNLEGQIKKVNLHKRIAEVELEFMGGRSVVHLGIEMVEKVN